MSGHAGAPPADADAVGVPHGEPMDIRPDDLSPGGDAFTERWAPGTLHTFEVKAVLRDRVTPFQHLRVLDTVDLGRVMVLDVAVQVAERGEASYHELLVHPGLCRRGARRASDRRVLVIGGGDGGSAREALRHPDVAHVDLVDIDPEVTAAARDLLPTVWRRPDGAGPLDDDPRFHLHHADGLAFLAAAGEPYDLVVVDATDPVGPGRVLFSEPFYEAVKARLRPEGAVAVQAGSWFALPEALRLAHAGLSAVFPRAAVYQCWSPVYPGGLWNLALGTFGDDPADVDADRASALAGLEWYDAAVHRAAFALPAAARRVLDPNR